MANSLALLGGPLSGPWEDPLGPPCPWGVRHEAQARGGGAQRVMMKPWDSTAPGPLSALGGWGGGACPWQKGRDGCREEGHEGGEGGGGQLEPGPAANHPPSDLSKIRGGGGSGTSEQSGMRRGHGVRCTTTLNTCQSYVLCL